VIIFIKFLVLFLVVSSLQAKTIKDLNNQDITVPDRVEAAFGSSPPMNYLLYALNPDKMSGLNFSAKNQNNLADEAFLSKKFLSLPVIGSFHGGGQSINLETIIKHNPDLILLWEDDLLIDKVQKEIAKTNIPTITLPFRKIETMPRSIAFAGEAIGEKARGDLLASYTQSIIGEIKGSLENVKPTKYYYAEGVDGLSTECSVSFHVEALNFAGGENVHRCEQRALLGLEKINFETLISYDPDIIIAQNTMTYNNIMKNPLWQHLRAVKEKNVHIVPNNPFNWIDRPPSFMRIIGIQWLTKLFHNQEYKINMHERVKEFYKLFLNVELSDAQVRELLGEKK